MDGWMDTCKARRNWKRERDKKKGHFSHWHGELMEARRRDLMRWFYRQDRRGLITSRRLR